MFSLRVGNQTILLDVNLKVACLNNIQANEKTLSQVLDFVNKQRNMERFIGEKTHVGLDIGNKMKSILSFWKENEIYKFVSISIESEKFQFRLFPNGEIKITKNEKKIEKSFALDVLEKLSNQASSN